MKKRIQKKYTNAALKAAISVGRPLAVYASRDRRHFAVASDVPGFEGTATAQWTYWSRASRSAKDQGKWAGAPIIEGGIGMPLLVWRAR